MADLPSYPYVTYPQYKQTFAQYISQGNTEYQAMLDQAKRVTTAFKGNPVDLFSIGAGIGHFEQDLQSQCGLKIGNFIGLEPNPGHARELETRAASWDLNSYKVITGGFGDEQHTDKKFDMVLMSHMLYHIPNLEEALLKARSYLKAEGKLVIFMQNHNYVVRKFETIARLNGEKCLDYGDHSLTDAGICEVFKRLIGNAHGYKCYTSPAVMDVTAFINRTNYDGISFLIQTMFEDLTQDIQDELYQFVKERANCNDDNKWTLSRPVSMILVDSN